MSNENISPNLLSQTIGVNILAFDPANARKHDKRNIEAIKASLVRFGQVKPIVLHKNGKTVIAGNGTLQAAKELGWKRIAVVKTNLEGTDATAYGIADNRTAELAAWDIDTLAQLTENLDNDMVSDIGFADGELDRLLGKDSELGTAEPFGGESLERYNNVTVKRFQFFYDIGPYEDLCKKLDEVMEENDLLSHAEAVLFLAGIEIPE